jgi:glucokinase
VSLVLGIDFGGTKVALATATPSGELLRTARIATRATDGAAQLRHRTVEAARELVDASPGPRPASRLVSAGVATFGVVRAGCVRLAPGVEGWDGLALPSLLQGELGVPTLIVENDVNAAATAELRWGRLAGVDVGLYVNLGTGLGAALIAGGRVVPGAHGATGEIGYLLREPREHGYAAGRAPLEELTSGGGLAARGSALLGEPVTAAELFARHGEPPVAALLDEAAEAIAMAVANLATFVDPERVVIGGGMAAAFLPAIRTAIGAAVPFPPPVEAAHFVDDAPLIGAVALGVQAAGNTLAATLR